MHPLRDAGRDAHGEVGPFQSATHAAGRQPKPNHTRFGREEPPNLALTKSPKYRNLMRCEVPFPRQAVKLRDAGGAAGPRRPLFVPKRLWRQDAHA